MIRFQLSASKFLSLSLSRGSSFEVEMSLRCLHILILLPPSKQSTNQTSAKTSPALLGNQFSILSIYLASILKPIFDCFSSPILPGPIQIPLLRGQHQIILKKVISLIYIDIKFRFNGRIISKTFPVSQHFIHSFIVFHFPTFSAVLPLVFGFIRSQSCCSPTHLRHAFLSLLCNISHFVFIHFHSVCCCCCAQDV